MAAVTSAIKFDSGSGDGLSNERNSIRPNNSKGYQSRKESPPEPESFILPHQEKVRRYYESSFTQAGAAVLIFSNFIVSAARAQVSANMSHATSKRFDSLEVFFAIIFTVELVWNMYGFWFAAFWKNAWNIFDFVIVTISVLSLILSNLPGIAVLRLFRAFRVFRLSRRIRSLKQIVEGVIASMPGVANAFVILVMLMGIWSIMGVEFFSDVDEEYFGTFIKAMLTMWQVITLDAWSDVCRNLIFNHHMPLAALFFVSFIFIAAIVMANVVVAVLLDKFLASNASEKQDEVDSDADDTVVNQAFEDLFRQRTTQFAPLPSTADSDYVSTVPSLPSFTSTTATTTEQPPTSSPSVESQRDFLIRSIQDLTTSTKLQSSSTKQLLELATTLDSIFQPMNRPPSEKQTHQNLMGSSQTQSPQSMQSPNQPPPQQPESQNAQLSRSRVCQ
eukprot:c10881_g1_i1.p1 GENE.c10881_g1_i1~~c10881_g1_i1.p1  ORF type:complete len:446 (-),score=82.53 c10881_g1_i1:255-1592(-)